MNEPMRELDLITAALNLSGATKSHSALLPIPDTTPQLYVGFGEAGDLVKMVGDVAPGESSKITEALGHLTEICDFAYKNGMHELGYDPVAVLRAAAPAPIQSAELAEVEGDSVFDYIIERMLKYAGEESGDVKCRKAYEELCEFIDNRVRAALAVPTTTPERASSEATEVERLTMELQNQREITQHWKMKAISPAAQQEQAKPTDLQALANVIRESGFVTWRQAHEIAEAIERHLATPTKGN
jgi:hypothetical protein